jgi:hypothetical protein
VLVIAVYDIPASPFPNISASPLAVENTITKWMQFDGLSSIVQSWVDGTQQNYGFMVKTMNPTNEGSDHFNPKEAFSGTYLLVNYEFVSVPVPIPGAVLPLGSGLLSRQIDISINVVL